MGAAPPIRRQALAIRLKGERDRRGKVRGWAFIVVASSFRQATPAKTISTPVHPYKWWRAISPPAKKPIRGAAPGLVR